MAFMDCPYCSDRLIRQIQHQQVYWFCRSCWQQISPIEDSPIVDSPIVDLLPVESPSFATLIQKSEMRMAPVDIDTHHPRRQAGLKEAQCIEKTMKSA
jgi:hypothetical protein